MRRAKTVWLSSCVSVDTCNVHAVVHVVEELFESAHGGFSFAVVVEHAFAVIVVSSGCSRVHAPSVDVYVAEAECGCAERYLLCECVFADDGYACLCEFSLVPCRDAFLSIVAVVCGLHDVFPRPDL